MNALLRLDYLNTHLETKRFLSMVLKCYTLLYTVGVLYAAYCYWIDNEIFLFVAKTVSVLLALFVFILFYTGKLEPIKAVMANLAMISSVVYVSTIYEGLYPGLRSDEKIMLNMMICLVGCIVGALASLQYISFLISGGAVTSYIIAAVLLKDPVMYRYLPSLIIILFGVSSFMWYYQNKYKPNVENARLQEEQERLLRFFELEPDEWYRIRDNKMSTEDIRDFLQKMGERMYSRVVDQAKELVLKDERIIDSLKKAHCNMTPAELEICCLIIRGKTISQICEIRHVSPSTVTSIRSRLRTKLKLKKEDNLQRYLRELVCADLD